MANETDTGRTDWFAESARATVFLTEPMPETDRANWWEAAVGEAPESVEERQREGIVRHVGDFGSGRLTLQIQRNHRIDWYYTAPKEFPEAGPAHIGHYEEVFDTLQRLFLQWLPKAPAFKRLAFGSAVLHSTSSQKESYVLLNEYLPDLQLSLENTSDFSYQINRRRFVDFSNEPQLRVNRLSKWSAFVVYQGRGLQAQPAEGAISLDLAGASEFHGAQMELDINTDAQRTNALSTDDSSEIFRYLVSCAEEIVRNGDIP